MISKFYTLLLVDDSGVFDISSLPKDTKEFCEKGIKDIVTDDPHLNDIATSWKLNGFCQLGLGYSEGYYGISYLCKSIGSFPSCADKIKGILERFNKANPAHDMGNTWATISIVSYVEDYRIEISHPSLSAVLIVKDEDFSNPIIESIEMDSDLPLEYKEICGLLPQLINSSLTAWSKKSDKELTEVDLIFPVRDVGIPMGDNFVLGISNAMSENSDFYEGTTEPETYRMAYIWYSKCKDSEG